MRVQKIPLSGITILAVRRRAEMAWKAPRPIQHAGWKGVIRVKEQSRGVEAETRQHA